MEEHERHEWAERVERKLDTLIRKVDILAADLVALDQAITDLGTQAAAEEQAVNDLIAKIQASPVADDFSTEVAALQALSGGLSASAAAAAAALNPPTP